MLSQAAVMPNMASASPASANVPSTCCRASGSCLEASPSTASSTSMSSQVCAMIPDGSSLADPATRQKLLPRSSSPRADPSHASRPSLYFDAQFDPRPSPLFTRRIDWLLPEHKKNVLYYVPASLHPASNHLQLFTKWQKVPRVEAGWKQAWEEEEQRKYLQGVQDRDDQLALIGYWSDSEEELGEPWGYIEIYWAKESNLQPFYNFPDQTLGFHALVGEEHFRGPNRVRAWMASVVYMIYSLEPRCDLVVSEPNIVNEKMVNYECECGGRVEKPIKLPHKTAALVFFNKAAFCKVWPLGPRPAVRAEA
ncbi:unnamed protein product [Sympodiomycopsis kandeliae]